MKSRYVVRITPADAGRRVSIRSRTHSEPPATDTVGLLLEWADDVLVVERRDGTLVRIAAGDLLAGKTIPPAVPRSSG